MTTISEASALLQTELPTAAWDVGSFLSNAKTMIQNWGGGILMLVGVAGLVWGGVLSSQHQSWATIVLLFVVGGALAAGGWTLVFSVGSGGKKTIEDLGGGTVIVQTVDRISG